MVASFHYKYQRKKCVCVHVYCVCNVMYVFSENYLPNDFSIYEFNHLQEKQEYII